MIIIYFLRLLIRIYDQLPFRLLRIQNVIYSENSNRFLHQSIALRKQCPYAALAFAEVKAQTEKLMDTGGLKFIFSIFLVFVKYLIHFFTKCKNTITKILLSFDKAILNISSDLKSLIIIKFLNYIKINQVWGTQLKY